MTGIVPVFLFLDEASIYAFLDLALDPVDLVLWGGVWTLFYHRPFKLGFEFEIHLDVFFARQRWGQRSKNLLVFLNELTETGVQVHALQFLNEIFLSMEVALPFFLFLHTPHCFRGYFIPPVLATLLGIVKRVHQRFLRIRKSHLFIILLRPYRLFAGPLEEVEAGPSLDTLSISP